jgi:predicted MFS family arabinose efflux permease
MLMRDQVESGRRTLLANGRELLDLFRRPHILAVEWIGIQRMFVKFALLGFLPVYLVEFRDLDTGFAGLLLGASAFTGVAVAAFAERLMRRGTIRGWVAASLFLASGSVLGYVIAPTAPAVLVAGVLFGAADGLSSVLSNSLVAIATEGDVRASFVAATGAARNLAKAVSPAVVGGLVLLLPLGGALAAIGIAGMLGSAAGRALGPIEARLRSAEAG